MIYLDHNATSPLLGEVRAAMEPWWGVPANPASAHRSGQRARSAVEAAREAVAALVGGSPAGVVFTGGATEANHAWYAGVVAQGVRHVAVAPIEHPCVLAAAGRVVQAGGHVCPLPVSPDGRILLDVPAGIEALSVMAANHETGVLQPVEEAIGLAERRGMRLHVDASQAAGRVPLALGRAEAVVLSSHKLGGPGGVGALVLRDGEPFPPLLAGGGQERGRRAGTVFTAGVVGFGTACSLALERLTERQRRQRRLTGVLRVGLRGLGARIVGAEALPNTTACVFPGVRGELLVQALDLEGICVSSGAACSSGSLEPSAVLTAMGDPEPEGVVRISIGPETKQAELDVLLETLPRCLSGIRAALDLTL